MKTLISLIFICFMVFLVSCNNPLSVNTTTPIHSHPSLTGTWEATFKVYVYNEMQYETMDIKLYLSDSSGSISGNASSIYTYYSNPISETYSVSGNVTRNNDLTLILKPHSGYSLSFDTQEYILGITFKKIGQISDDGLSFFGQFYEIYISGGYSDHYVAVTFNKI